MIYKNELTSASPFTFNAKTYAIDINNIKFATLSLVKDSQQRAN